MKKMLMCLVILAAISSFAAGVSESKTTDMFAPKAGSSEVWGGLALYTGKDEVGTSSLKYSGFLLAAEYGYGFSDFAAFYVSQNYLALEVTPSQGSAVKVSGIADTTIGVKAVVDFEPAFIYYDIAYEMALLEKPKKKSNGDITAGNTRPEVKLQLGAGTSIDVFGFGAKLNYSLFQDGDFDNNGTPQKYKSGTGSGWKVYGQFQANFKLGLSYEEQIENSYDIDSTNVLQSFRRTYALYSIFTLVPAPELFVELQKPEGGNATVTYSTYLLAASYRATF